ncbi:MAG: bifunctional phosphopantothenoylcysteine decarboxylase/phosphopantothenate--cysteine ligase CoaBC [Gammaproteobacteria bacterium]
MGEALANKRIIVGITAGIAAYKAAELVRRLCASGAEVQVVMTPSACNFVGPLTLQALSGRAVRSELLDPDAEAGMGHIELARWPDRILIAPATADFLARLAHGLADDLLSTLCLATAAPIAVAPAMNQQMWRAAATQANVSLLAARGVEILGPAQGEQACGDVGPGRMLEPAEIVEALQRTGGALAGVRVLVTAGPTREAIDPVRFISNRSSGKMGYAVARAALEAGAQVTLVTGPVQIPAPAGARMVPVESAAAMAEAVRAGLSQADIFIGCAAVADYRPALAAGSKIKKSAQTLALTLERTTDILAEVARSTPRPFTVGFAAETENLQENARGKLERKGLDMIAANLVAQAGLGFEVDDNELEVFWPGGGQCLPRAGKQDVARALVGLVAARYSARRAAAAG